MAGVLVVLAGIAFALGSYWMARAEPDAVALPAGMPGRLVAVGAHPVHVVERGSGPPVLLVHGFGGSTYDAMRGFLDARVAPPPDAPLRSPS